MDADVRQAVQDAKQHLLRVFADENIENIRLEEVEFDDAASGWKITIGFTRPLKVENPLVVALGGLQSERFYKVVSIDRHGDMVSIKDRIPVVSG